MLTAAVSGVDANNFNLTVGKLVRGEDVHHLSTPQEAKAYEDTIKNQLRVLKDHILGNEGIEKQSDTFEI